jgi:hypothetical protein
MLKQELMLNQFGFSKSAKTKVNFIHGKGHVISLDKKADKIKIVQLRSYQQQGVNNTFEGRTIITATFNKNTLVIS